MKQAKRKGGISRPWSALLLLFCILAALLFITKSDVRFLETPLLVPCVVGTITGLFGIAFFAGNIIRYLRTSDYKQGMATVTRAQVTTIEDTDGTWYLPQISYTYAVRSEEYSSGRVRPSDAWNGSSLESVARKLVNKYPEGKTVRVFYDPSRPGEAFPERERLLPNVVFLLVIARILLALVLARADVMRF
jgi:hypothetical protein